MKKRLTIDDCYDCPESHSDLFTRIVCGKTGSVVGAYSDEHFPIPADCPLPDAEDAEQPTIIGVDFASGPDRTACWPNDDADIAADAEGKGC